MQVGVAREKRHSVENLSKNAPHGPCVHSLAVGSVTDEEFGCSVPPRRDVVRVLVIFGRVQGSCEAEVAEFDQTSLTDEKVLRLDVTMNDFGLMQEVVGLEDLVNDGLDPVDLETIWRGLQFLKESLLDVVKDEEQFALFAKDRPQVDNVDMLELPQDPDFAHHGLAHMNVFVLLLFELLNGDDSACLSLLRLENFAVGAFADHLQHAISIHASYLYSIS